MRSCFQNLSCVLVALLLPRTADAGAPGAADAYGDPLPPGAIARIGTVRWRHPGIEGLAYVGDGKHLLSWSTSDLRLWDSASGKLLKRADQKLVGGIKLAAASADGKVIAWVAEEGKIRLWDVEAWETLQKVKPLAEPTPPIAELAVSPGGRMVAARLKDVHGILLWETEKGRFRILEGDTTWVGDFVLPENHCLLFASGGELLLSAGFDRLRTWAVPDSKLLHSIKTNSGERGRLTLAPDGDTLAWRDGEDLRFMAVRSGVELCPPRSLKSLCLAFMPDANSIVCSRWRSGMLEWKSGKVSEWTKKMGVWLRISVVRPDGKVLVGIGPDPATIVRWSLPDGRDLEADEVPPTSFRAWLTPDNRSAVSDDLKLWDANTGKLQRRFQGEIPERCIVSSDGKWLAGVFNFGKFAVWEVGSGKQVASLADDRALGLFGPLDFHADGRVLLTGGVLKGSGTYRELAWDWKAAPPAVTELPRFGEASCLFRTHNGGPAKLVRHGDLVHITDFDGRRSRAFEREDFYEIIDYDPTGRLALFWLRPITMNNELYGRVGVLETATGRLRCTVSHYDYDYVPDGALLPSGHLLILDRGSLALHSAWTGKLLARVTGHDGAIYSFSVSRDFTRLVTTGFDTTALVWDLPALIAKATAKLPVSGIKELEIAWQDLGATDPSQAGRALGILGAAPIWSLSLLRARLEPTSPATLEQVQALLDQLAHPRFAKRYEAEQALTKLGDLAEPGLRDLLGKKLDLELRRRAERLLQQLEDRPLSSETLRSLRVVELLEHFGTAEAYAQLQTLAERSPLAWGTREAREALERRGHSERTPASGGTSRGTDVRQRTESLSGSTVGRQSKAIKEPACLPAWPLV
jgi:WD40 repeat protein